MSEQNDMKLSKTYRELSDEYVPDDLNARVLQEAAQAARIRPQRRAWLSAMRPLALAASIALAVIWLPQYFGKSELPGNGRMSLPREPVQAGGIADPGRLQETPRSCAEAQTAGRSSWRSCIEGLRRNGRREDADREQDLFDRHYEK